MPPVRIPALTVLLVLAARPAAAQEPIPLDTVQAVEEAWVPSLARAGFYERRAKGFGQFRTREEIEALHPVFPEDVFWGMSGVRLLGDGTVVTSSSDRRCALTVAVDGVVVQRGGRVGGAPVWTEVVHVNDIEAIEVYPHPNGVPVWLAGTLSPCGAVVIWTKGSLQ